MWAEGEEGVPGQSCLTLKRPTQAEQHTLMTVTLCESLAFMAVIIADRSVFSSVGAGAGAVE